MKRTRSRQFLKRRDRWRPDAIKTLLNAHYHLMSNPRYWHDKGLMDASRILCVTASNIRRDTKYTIPEDGNWRNAKRWAEEAKNVS